MLVVTVDKHQRIRLETPSGDLIGRIHIGKTQAERIRVAIDLPKDIRIIREPAERSEDAR